MVEPFPVTRSAIAGLVWLTDSRDPTRVCESFRETRPNPGGPQERDLMVAGGASAVVQIPKSRVGDPGDPCHRMNSDGVGCLACWVCSATDGGGTKASVVSWDWITPGAHVALVVSEVVNRSLNFKSRNCDQTIGRLAWGDSLVADKSGYAGATSVFGIPEGGGGKPWKVVGVPISGRRGPGGPQKENKRGFTKEVSIITGGVSRRDHPDLRPLSQSRTNVSHKTADAGHIPFSIWRASGDFESFIGPWRVGGCRKARRSR